MFNLSKTKPHIFVAKVNRYKEEQAQSRAAAETAAFIRVVRYNDESSFNLHNDFEMNAKNLVFSSLYLFSCFSDSYPLIGMG